ncbi:MAG: hypothetical protein H7A43_00755 [Verrucomicrobia bacterium]|nr:hypothetical protein [Kiritimatiellia bacterium]MCP5487158.1 hypothetical protein [Verrucomicrobiota bacterium]
MSYADNLSIQERRSHFRNVASVAAKDGVINNEERAVLAFVAQKWKLTDEDLRDVTEHPNAIEMALPNDRLACFQQLYDLVEIMIVDGMVRIKERELCTSLAVNLGFTPDAVDTIIQAILKGNLSSRDEKDIQADLIRKLL